MRVYAVVGGNPGEPERWYFRCLADADSFVRELDATTEVERWDVADVAYDTIAFTEWRDGGWNTSAPQRVPPA